MQHNTLTLKALATLPHNRSNLLVERVCEWHMVYNAVFEERERADSLGAVNDLIWDDKISRLDFLLQATNGREGDNGSHAERTESGDIGTSGHLVWGILVVQAVTSEEGNGYRLAGGW
jgi:hypothetical protein